MRKRGFALAARDRETQFHVAKNRYLTLLRNDRPWDYVRNLPFILARDLGTVLVLLATAPGVLARLWRERGLFSRALRLRRLDAARAKRHVSGGV